MSAWPIHPHPQPDELLSSWMIRLAHANSYKVHDFYTLYFGRERQIWNRDIDHLAPDWLLNGLSYHTGHIFEQLQPMCLRSYEGIVYEKFNETTSTRGLLPLGIYHRTRRNYGQQFCPLCLLEDEQPYLRKIWRIAYITICEQHQIILHDRCEYCGNPIMPHRADMTNKVGIPTNIGIEFCGCCGKKFTGENIVAVSSKTTVIHQMVFDSIKHGYILLDSKPLYSFLFLEGIRTLVQGKVRIEHTKGKYGMEKFEIEKCNTQIRHHILNDCWELLDSWPINFTKYISRHKQAYSNFVSKNSDGFAPCWIEQTIKSNL